jgi:hypothetical protein
LQFLQLVEPEEAAYFPALQLVQLVERTAAAYFPAAHLAQIVDADPPFTENVPAVQAVQMAVPVAMV